MHATMMNNTRCTCEWWKQYSRCIFNKLDSLGFSRSRLENTEVEQRCDNGVNKQHNHMNRMTWMSTNIRTWRCLWNDKNNNTYLDNKVVSWGHSSFGRAPPWRGGGVGIEAPWLQYFFWFLSLPFLFCFLFVCSCLMCMRFFFFVFFCETMKDL